MEITSINTESLSRMFLAGAKNLEAKKEWINELNVFPVPDGDTGTNMSMTIMSAAREVGALSNPTMKELAKAISSGSLRGARGNSGVILSQLFRGFCKVIKEYDEVDVSVLCDAFQKAVETAYKAVMKPKEGTILTVAKGAADKALDLAQETEDLVYFCDEVIKHAEYVLSQTPEMLPVLKQAGVVDSGGQGLVQVLKGAYDSLLGKEIDYSIEETPASAGTAKVSEPAEQEIKYGYCTEFIIVLTRPLSEKEEKEYKSYLESIGDSIVVVADDEVVKTHVHTNDPGLAIQKALTHGSLTKIKIDNMREEHQEKLIKDAEKAAARQKEQEAEKEEPRKPMGFIAVSIGEGMNEIFRGLGADYLIEGGQTMNPSTEDMLAAIDHVNADHIFILPNNKNIIMAANQAAELTEDKDIIVLPTKTIPQGIVALVNYIPDYTAEENKEAMLAELDSVKTGQVTYAVRDTEIDGMQIRQNDYMGIGDKAILAVGTDLKETTMKMIDAMVDEDSIIDCFATEVWINNKWDWPGKNWSMWKSTVTDETNPYADGKWRFLVYDVEFGGISGSDDKRGNAIMASGLLQTGTADPDSVNHDKPHVRCFALMMTNEAFREKFIARMESFSTGMFAYDRAIENADLFQGVYQPILQQFFERFPTNSGMTADKAINGDGGNTYGTLKAIRNFLNGRDKQVTKISSYIRKQYTADSTPSPKPTGPAVPTASAEVTETPALPTGSPSAAPVQPSVAPVQTTAPSETPKSTSVKKEKLADGTIVIKKTDEAGQVVSTKYETKTGIYLLKSDNTLCYQKENQTALKNQTSVVIRDVEKINGKSLRVSEIEKGTFQGLSKLKKITIGKNVVAIGQDAFRGCSSLKKITIRSVRLKKVGKNAIRGVHKKVQIICPKGKKKAYQKLFEKKTGFAKKTMTIK